MEAESNYNLKFLTPQNCKIFNGDYHLSCVEVEGKIFNNVFAVLSFPVSKDDSFIQLKYLDTADDKDHEIGVIENLSDFPKHQQEVIKSSLKKYYFERNISRVFKVEFKYGQLFFDVQTEKGKSSFQMWWSHDKAQDFGEYGKVLIDVFENRYIIKDVRLLPKHDYEIFTHYIYW